MIKMIEKIIIELELKALQVHKAQPVQQVRKAHKEYLGIQEQLDNPDKMVDKDLKVYKVHQELL